ncbi:hypothetical protein ACTVFP_23050, partial [Escherichia coli]|uniref:hypothetical protein n=2 Tax=Gammaproteobacteria TaxID=1236 RepID=UPI003FA5D12F
AFENCLPDQMKSTSVVYICENQPWEYSLCRSSLVRGCENIVASLQATVRFWDLRYLQNVQKSHFINGRELFAPHYVASNSASVSEKMRMTPSDIIRQVESYRMGNVSSSDRSVENDDNVIIVAGEYSNSHTLTLLNAINKVGSDVLSSYS